MAWCTVAWLWLINPVLFLHNLIATYVTYTTTKQPSYLYKHNIFTVSLSQKTSLASFISKICQTKDLSKPNFQTSAKQASPSLKFHVQSSVQQLASMTREAVVGASRNPNDDIIWAHHRDHRVGWFNTPLRIPMSSNSTVYSPNLQWMVRIPIGCDWYIFTYMNKWLDFCMPKSRLVSSLTPGCMEPPL